MRRRCCSTRPGSNTWRALVASSGSARFVAQALIAHWRATDELSSADDAATIAPADGPVFVLAGSQSATTARQIDAACAQRDGAGPLFHRVTADAPRLNGLELMLNGGQMGLRICSNSCCALLDRQLLGDVPLCHSSARPVFRGRRGGILEVQVTVSAPAAPCESVD